MEEKLKKQISRLSAVKIILIVFLILEVIILVKTFQEFRHKQLDYFYEPENTVKFEINNDLISERKDENKCITKARNN